MPELIIDFARTFAVAVVPVLFAITLHEVAHGWAARWLGDPTAAEQGRLSLNPVRHIDPVGTLLVPAVLAALGGFIFGWAKPVPVNMQRLAQPRRDMALVALAGPASNLLMAIGWAFAYRSFLSAPDTTTFELLRSVCEVGIVINLVLMVLNLLPLPPLDGSRVLNGVLPEAWARQVDRIEPWGLMILLALLATGVLGRILEPGLQSAGRLVLGVTGLGGVAAP